jgi:hypothetical protein
MLGLRQTHFNVPKLTSKLQFLLSLSSLFFTFGCQLSQIGFVAKDKV